MNSSRRAVRALPTVLLASALAGCGMLDDFRYPYAKESADTIFLDAMKATTGAESLRISGSFDPKGSSTFWLSLMSDGERRCSGQVSFVSAEFDVVSTPEGDYLKGSSASWEDFAEVTDRGRVGAVRMLADRWVNVGRAKGVRLGQLCDLARDLLTAKEAAAVDAGRVPDNLELTHKGLSEAGGEKAVKINVADDEGTTDLWVSLDEPHYVLKLAGRDTKGAFEVALSDFGFPADVEAPEGKKVLDLSAVNRPPG